MQSKTLQLGVDVCGKRWISNTYIIHNVVNNWEFALICVRHMWTFVEQSTKAIYLVLCVLSSRKGMCDICSQQEAHSTLLRKWAGEQKSTTKFVCVRRYITCCLHWPTGTHTTCYDSLLQVCTMPEYTSSFSITTFVFDLSIFRPWV